MLARCLAAYGVSDIFSSPGSRNAPLLMAFARCPDLTLRHVIDERSAAFIALGFASVSRKPVALVCTSGTAMLNYAPAVAEAFYRKLPLIVITADRPTQWIDQDDSQTLHQAGALANIVKASYTVKGEIGDEQERWFVNRMLNEAMHSALEGRRGPVHINIPLSEPLTATVADPEENFRKISMMLPPQKLDPQDARRLATELQGKNILITGGFCPPSAEINKAFSKIGRLGDVVVTADALSNIHADGVLHTPDSFIGDRLLRHPHAAPDILITFGGSILSKNLKDYLRTTRFSEHWHVGTNDMLIDSYFSLTRRIEIDERLFFPRLANALEYLGGESMSTFKTFWHEAAFNAATDRQARMKETGWSEGKVVELLMKRLPAEWNLQLSNGLSPRYAMRGEAWRFHRCDCNRGVSGIDGSVSTALGASLPFKGTTLLLTGDMSMQYDIAALSSTLLSPRLKIIVINNGGGGIFRKIGTTRGLPERDRLFVSELNLPLEGLAAAYGLDYFKADSFDSLDKALPLFAETNTHPAILEIIIQQQ